jgi:intracellular septation protein
MTQAAPRRLKGSEKFLVDFGPLLVFFVGYFFGARLAPLFGAAIPPGEELFVSVAAFLPAFAVAFIYSVAKERRIAPMLLVSGIAVGVLGALTLVFHNKTFFYMKPTIIYAMFALLLQAGTMTGRNPLKALFDGAMTMPDAAWRTLTKRYVFFFALLAVINEIAWRWLMRDCDLGGEGKCGGEAAWINLKVFGFTLLNLVFAAAQAPFISKHLQETAND